MYRYLTSKQFSSFLILVNLDHRKDSTDGGMNHTAVYILIPILIGLGIAVGVAVYCYRKRKKEQFKGNLPFLSYKGERGYFLRIHIHCQKATDLEALCILSNATNLTNLNGF